MRRIHTVFAALAPVLLAGALLGASARSTRADDGNDVTQDLSDDDADADSNDAARDAQQAARDAQHAARDEARAAVRQAREEARNELRRARDQVMHDSSIPPAIREMVLKRLDQASRIVDRHLDRAANADDLGTLGAEMSAMGAELGQAMGGISGDVQKLQKDMGKSWKFHFDGNGGSAAVAVTGGDDDPDVHVNVVPPIPPMPPMPPLPPLPPMPPTPSMSGTHGDFDVDMSDLDINVNLDDLQLSQQQRDQLGQILGEEQRASDHAEEVINGLSDGLRGMLQDPDASESEIGSMVDRISAAEGEYRKERILAWTRARKILNDQQRGTLMSATRHGHHHQH